MPIQRFFTFAAVLALPVAGLCACDSGGSPPPPDDQQSVILRDDADVKRELGMIFSIFGVNSNLQYLRGVPRHPLPHPDNCSQGNAEVETGTQTYSFELFPSSGSVNYERYSYDGCAYVVPPYYQWNGFYETGVSNANGEGRRHRYMRFGAGDEPYSQRVQEDTYYMDEVTGLVETQLAGDMETHRSRGRFAVQATFGYDYPPNYYSRELELGSDALPFSEVYETEQRRLDGPYRYSTAVCAGGSLILKTLTPLRHAEFDGSRDVRFVDGALEISSGTSSVRVKFNPDTSATLTFADNSVFTDNYMSAISAEDMGALYRSWGDCHGYVRGEPSSG